MSPDSEYSGLALPVYDIWHFKVLQKIYPRILVQEMKRKKFNFVFNFRKVTHLGLCLFGTQVSMAVSVCAEKGERLWDWTCGWHILSFS